MAYVIFLLCNIVLYVLYNLVHSTSIWTHFALSPFIYGVSKFKLNFFILYFSLLSILMIAPWKLKSARVVSWLKRVNILAIFSALVAGALSFIFFIRHFSLPLEKYAYHFKGSYHSINYFAHIHTSKTPIVYLLNFLGRGFLNKEYDTGFVFAEYVNPWLVFIISISAVASFLAFLLLLKPLIEKWPRGKRFFVFFIYAFAGAHILKCLIDGGIFSYDLLPSLIVIHLLCDSHDPVSFMDLFRKRQPFYFFAAVFYLAICAFISFNDALLQIPIGIVFMTSVYALLFFPVLFQKWSFKSTAVTLLCFFYVCCYWSMHGLGAIESMRDKIVKGDRVLLYDYPEPGALPAVKDKTEQMRGKRVFEVYEELGENPLRNRRAAIIKRGGEKTTGFIFILKIIKSKDEVVLNSNRLMKIDKMTPFERCGKKAYLVKISFNPDLVPPLWSEKLSDIDENNKYCVLFLLNHYFLERGITEYAIVPYYFFNVAGGLE